MQVLLFERAYARVGERLAAEVPGAEPVVWHTDGTFTRDGETVPAEAIAPRAAWISGDLFGGDKLAGYADAMAALPSLEWVQTANAGLDHPLYARLAASGIRFSKSGAQSIPIAEYVLAYALEYAQDLAFRRTAQAESQWRHHRFKELWHSNWLIIGYGHIGGNVAKRAKAFDCRTVIVRQSPRADEYADAVITLADINEHIPDADVIVLACPATDETRGLVNADFLSRVKPGALLVNIARGSLIDAGALLASLESDRPGRAVLDVFDTEPLPTDNPLWTHPKVTVTAHISNAGSGTAPRGDDLFLGNLQRFVAGETPTDISPV